MNPNILNLPALRNYLTNITQHYRNNQIPHLLSLMIRLMISALLVVVDNLNVTKYNTW